MIVNKHSRIKIKNKILDKDTSSIVFNYLYGDKQYYKRIFNKTIKYINVWCKDLIISSNKIVLIRLIKSNKNHFKLPWQNCKILYNCDYHYNQYYEEEYQC